MSTTGSAKVKIQKMGSFLSAMVMPNIGAFIAWGLLAAFFIPTGWYPNEDLNNLVGPTMKYILPVLIGYTGGYNVYGRRGGVAGALSTVGVVIGADITMLIGGMIMGPLGALCIKTIDNLFKDKVKPGLEMLIDNFSMGISMAIVMIIGYLIVEPIFSVVLAILASGVQYLVDANLLPFTSIFVQPGQVLFLNNFINHGIMVPIGIEEAARTGKSLLFLVEANGGTWLGLLLAFSFFGKGAAKKSAPGASFIMCFGGIGEIAYPYVLIKPWTVLGPMVGNIVALFILQIFNGGTVGPVSPGSFLALLAMTPKGCFTVNIAAYVVATIVSFAIVSFFLLLDKKHSTEDMDLSENSTLNTTKNDTNVTVSDVQSLENIAVSGIKKIAFACDAGMGSSVMGVSMLKTKLQKAMLPVELVHTPINEIPEDIDLIITNVNLAQRVKDTVKQKYNKEVPILSMKNFLDQKRYDEIIKYLKEHK